MAQITLWMDGRIPVTVDEEEFEIIKLMVAEAGGDKDLKKLRPVVDELVKQGYRRGHAMELCILARHSY